MCAVSLASFKLASGVSGSCRVVKHGVRLLMNLKNRLGHLSCDFPFPTLCPQNELTLVLSGLELKPRPVLGGSF